MMLSWKTCMWLSMSATAGCNLITFFLYLGYRCYCLTSAHFIDRGDPREAEQMQHPQTLGLAWAMFGLEILLLFPNILPYLIRTIAICPPHRIKRRFTGNSVPHIDVLITCCKEDIAVILDTVRAACVLDYPRSLFRVFVCDDGASKQLQHTISEMQLKYNNLHYTARTKGPVRDFKAGNLNHGVLYSASTPLPNEYYCSTDPAPMMAQCLPVRSASTNMHEAESSSAVSNSDCATLSWSATSNPARFEYVAALDADMIPEPHWLRALLPHIVNDPTMAMVCPPQLFYDIPINDPLTQTMSQCAGITEIVNDALGHADCLGSGYILRRSALASIGGFPTESLSEDVCCSALMLGAGWKTAYVPEALQYGSVPDSFGGHLKQRTRWFVGHMQTAALLNFRLCGYRTKHSTIRQRLAGITFDLRQLVQIPLPLTFVIIPVVLLSGSPLVYWQNTTQLKSLIILACLWSICHWIHEGVVTIVGSISNGAFDIRTASYDSELERWIWPYMLLAFIRSFVLPLRLGGSPTGFTASGSMLSPIQERDPQDRAPLLRRLKVILLSHLAIVHLIFIIACVSAIGLAFARAFTSGRISGVYREEPVTTTSQQLLYLITRIGWPPIVWLQQTISAMTPILYAICPPAAAPRETLLDRDVETGVAYPKPNARLPNRTVWGYWRCARLALSLVYVVVLLGFSARF